MPNGVMVVSPLVVLKKWGPIVAMPNSPEVYAANFYSVLRELDAMGLREIFIELPPARPEWEAVRDRIIRATRPLEG
jgi:L-threonylcarbamoyladenylate synthase